MTNQFDGALTLLRSEGIARLGALLNPDRVGIIRAYLTDRPLFSSHVFSQSDKILRSFEHTQKLGVPCGCYMLATLIACPLLLELAMQVEPLATEYLGQEPVLYSINAWWSFPGGPVKADTQDWHRDPDDEKFCALFLYLTDMDEHTGHRYIRGSHNNPDAKPDEAFAERVAGTAGTCVITDPRGFHMGGKPTAEPRLIAWARFGVSDPPAAYTWDQTTPVHNPKRAAILNERQKRICRLILEGA